MKTILTALFSAIVTTFLIVSCSNNNSSNSETQSSRIVLKDFIKDDYGYRYRIFEIDGKEYVAYEKGGICPLTK